MSATHSSYPGLSISSYTLPVLNNVDYHIDYVAPSLEQSGKLVFTYEAISSKDISFETYLIDIKKTTITNENFLFYGQNNFEYVILENGVVPNETTVWTTGEDAIIPFTVNEEMDYTIYVKPYYGSALLDVYEAYSFTTPTEEDYLLAVAKSEAIKTLDTALANIDEASETIETIINNAKVTITSIRQYQKYDNILS